MADSVTIARRFRGPKTSSNGGYACGLVAAPVKGEAVEATLRIPPPLDVPMERELRADGSAVMLLGDELVGTAQPANPLELDIPDPPSFDEAAAAGANCPWVDSHLYPECFVCGPHRTPPDGLHLLSGPVPGRRMVADAWVPEAGDAAADGTIGELLVWAALDCPTAHGFLHFEPPEQPVLLGRLTAQIRAPVVAGERHVVIGWPIERDGRKHLGGSALFREDELLASAEGIWIEAKPQSERA